MQGEGKRPLSQPPPLHEQLSPPAGIHPLSTPPSSLTNPLPLKKKKLLKVILKAPPTPNPNRLSPSLSPPPSSPQPPSCSPPSLSTPLLPHHHHHLQQHQLHHHQQLLLQQQHLHKQRLLQQQTEQLASELQLKLHQQHLLQQEHPKILEQFKQQLQQEQICASSSLDSQSNSLPQWPQANPANKDQRKIFQGQENFEGQEKGEDRRNASSRRRRERSRELSCDPPLEERFAAQKSRFKFEDGGNWGRSQTLREQSQRSLGENGQEQAIVPQEDVDGEGEPGAKRPKLSEQDPEGNQHVRSSFIAHRQKPACILQEPVLGVGGVRRTPKPPVAFANGLPPPPRLSSAPSSAAPLGAQDARRLSHSTDPAAWNAPQSFSNSVSEGTGLRDGNWRDPSSKILGGSGNASVPGKKVLRGIIDKLQKKDSYGAFSEPVDANEVPDYYDVIKEPMDFGTIRKRISSNFYTSLELFEDIFAICSNAMTFNAAGTVYHRQARAIKAAAERILDALKTSGPAGAEAILKQKVAGSHIKKSHKKKQPWKSWTSDYVAEPSSNVGGRGVGRVSAASVSDSYYVDWQGGATQTPSKVNTDDKEDPTGIFGHVYGGLGCLKYDILYGDAKCAATDMPGYLAKSLGLIDGRRWQLNEESRRSTYRPHSTTESSSLANTVFGGPLQFVPAAFQLDFSYARSLARFAADLGPEVWKVAGEKIRRALPVGVAFGPGWVGQREAPGKPIMPMINKMVAHGGTDLYSRTEQSSNDSGAQRSGNGCMPSGTAGVVDCKGATMTADQLTSNLSFDCTGRSAATHGHTEEGRSSETAIPQFGLQPQTTLGGSDVRDTDQLINCVEDSGSQQKRPPYPAQAACEGGLDVLHNCEGDPILIPGRDLDGRHCLEYKSVLVSTSVDGLQSRFEGVQSRSDVAQSRLDG